MNGERQLDEFISRPCKATLLAFAKSLFTGKRKSMANLRRGRLNSFWRKIVSIRWVESHCDLQHRNKTSGCIGCPFLVDGVITRMWSNEKNCYFTSKFSEASQNFAIKTSTVEQHQFPKLIMKDIGFLLLCAVKLKNTLELRREEKAVKKLDPG